MDFLFAIDKHPNKWYIFKNKTNISDKISWYYNKGAINEKS